MTKKSKTNQSKKRRATPASTRRPPAQGINPMMHPDAAGIDVGAEEFVAAVPPGRASADEPTIRTFTTFTSGVADLRDWLLSCGIKTAAMESTGNYWITLYDTLVQAGIDVYLVNARHVKGVPGKKTDVCDAQWLQQLHAAGLLKKSFRPGQDIVPLRFLMRHRSEMTGDAAKQLQLMQKTLTEPERSGDSQRSFFFSILLATQSEDPSCLQRHRRCERAGHHRRHPCGRT